MRPALSSALEPTSGSSFQNLPSFPSFPSFPSPRRLSRLPTLPVRLAWFSADRLVALPVRSVALARRAAHAAAIRSD